MHGTQGECLSWRRDAHVAFGSRAARAPLPRWPKIQDATNIGLCLVRQEELDSAVERWMATKTKRFEKPLGAQTASLCSGDLFQRFNFLFQ